MTGIMKAKLRPNTRCHVCVDLETTCTDCLSKYEVVTVLETGTNFWSGDYAIILHDGKMEKVPLSRLYDVGMV